MAGGESGGCQYAKHQSDAGSVAVKSSKIAMVALRGAEEQAQHQNCDGRADLYHFHRTRQVGGQFCLGDRSGDLDTDV